MPWTTIAAIRSYVADALDCLGHSEVLNTAPLLSYPYETQLVMKGTYIKSAVRSFTKQAQLPGSTVVHRVPVVLLGVWSEFRGCR